MSTLIPVRIPQETPIAHRESFALAILLILGVLAGTLWPHQNIDLATPNRLFVMEEEAFPPESILPPPIPDPIPSPPIVKGIDTPPPQFGLEKDALDDAGDLVVATGNTIGIPADSIVAPAPPTLPAAPIFINSAPKIIAGIPPEYPARAMDRGLEGVVVALITTDTNGIVKSVSIETSGGADFDGAVLKAAKQTRFQPPIQNGLKVSAQFRRPFEFILEE